MVPVPRSQSDGEWRLREDTGCKSHRRYHPRRIFRPDLLTFARSRSFALEQASVTMTRAGWAKRAITIRSRKFASKRCDATVASRNVREYAQPSSGILAHTAAPFSVAYPCQAASEPYPTE